MGRLFLRIFLWFWLATTCLLLVLSVGLLALQPDVLVSWRFIGQTAMHFLGVQAANTYERQGAGAAASQITNINRQARFGVWLYAADGRLVAGPPPREDAPDVVARALAGEEAEYRAGSGPPLLARRVTSDSSRQYVVLWEAPFRQRGLFLSPAPFALRMAALILTGSIVCGWLTWHLTRPVRTLRAAAQRFARGDLAVRVSNRRELQRRDELSELAREFDHMAARIEELVRSQQQLLADISHELRSPLARLSLALDLARRRLGDDVPEHQRIDREVHRLNELIEQLLTLARLKEQSGHASAQTFNLRDLLHEIVGDARFEAEAAGRGVVVARDCDAAIQGNRALLRSAIENVVRNAVRHTPESTTVTVSAERPEGLSRLVITVRDHGPGVPAPALERLFDPFFRVDESRDRSRGGVGLGLAITRQAMLAHGGSATAGNHPQGGLVVRLELPVWEMT